MSQPSLRWLRALWFGLGLLSGWAITSPVWAFKQSYATDVFFAHNSSEVPRDQYSKIEVLACRIRPLKIEVIVAIGHAAINEKNAKNLAEARAKNIEKIFLAQGVRDLYYVEEKGSSQPVAMNTTPSGRAKNRRVEIEVVAYGYHDYSQDRNCEPRWESQFLALERDKALVVARHQVREGWLKPVEPFVLALEKGRMDILAALLQPDAGISPNSQEKTAILEKAFSVKNVQAVRMLLDWGIRPAQFSSLEQPLLQACRTGNGVEVIQMLLKAGAKIQSSQVLECAVGRGDAALVSLLLQSGAHRFLSSEAVVRAGSSQEILDILLKAGADPLARTRCGETLFHTMRFQTPEQVQRLLDWGLDINAKGHRYSCGNPETSALQEALSYAPVVVLDFMVKVGARTDHASISSFDWSRAPDENLIWAIRHDIATAKSPDRLVWLAKDKKKIPVIDALLVAGVDVNGKDFYGKTALSVAIEYRQPEMVQYFVRQGADVQWVAGPASKKQSALELAQGLSVFKQPPPRCLWNCRPSEPVKPPPPEVDPFRVAVKEKILQILQETAKP